MRFLFFSPSRMSQPKFTAILRGEVLQDVASGQLFKLHPSEEELQRGIWEYNSEADGHRWNFVIIEGTTYAINGCFIDWEEEEVKEWDIRLMGQWPFGNRPTEEEEFEKEVEDVLLGLDYYLEGELEWMERMDKEMEAESESDSLNICSSIHYDLAISYKIREFMNSDMWPHWPLAFTPQ